MINSIYGIYDTGSIRYNDLIEQLDTLKQFSPNNDIVRVYTDAHDIEEDQFVSINEDRRKLVYLNWIPQNFKLSEASKSLITNHIKCLKLASCGDPNSWSIIIEDDILLVNHFHNTFKHIITNLPDDCNVLFPTSGKWPLHYSINEHRSMANLSRNTRYIHNIDNKNFELLKISASRCTDFILIKNTAASFILEKMILNRTALPIDWEYNYILTKYKDILHSYWITPALVRQNSKYL